MGHGFKPMSFGQHLYRVLQLEDFGVSRRRINATLQAEPSDVPNASMLDLARSDAMFWVMQSSIWDAEYLLECLNERYDRSAVLESVDQVTEQFDRASDDPLEFALGQPFPIRQSILTIALVKSLSPRRDVTAAVREFALPPGNKEHLTPISFPENLQRVFDLEELAGTAKENIPVLMDPLGWDLQDLESVDVPRVSNFDKACSEASEWVQRFTAYSEFDLRHHLAERYAEDLMVDASTSIEQNSNIRGNPLVLALQLPYPIRLTIVMLALHRWYGTGGESVNISSDLPPKPPAPGHWGGRTPGYEEPIPYPREDVDVGGRPFRS